VLVIGAGVAGTAAAVAAARAGARTILVEKEPYFGGTGYAGMFQHICGLYLNGEAVPSETLNPGIPREIARRLREAAPDKVITKIGLVHVLPYTREDLQSVLTAMCYAEKDVATLRGYAMVSVLMERHEVRTVSVEGPHGTQVITPKAVIDCSGSGEAAAMAGAEFELAPSAERQMAGFTMHLKGLKDPDDSLPIKVPFLLAKAVQEGKLGPLMRFTTFSPGDQADEGFCKMSVVPDSTPERDEQARNDAIAVHAYLSSLLPAFKGSYIAGMSPKVLEREERLVRGEYTLTAADILAARKFPDGVIKNAWPIELWDRTMGTHYQYVPLGDYYEVPFRCLQVQGIANMLTAGRCISVTHEALGSVRVMGACMALGEQAGKAAAYRVKHGSYPGDAKV